jgi:uncharacterized protein (TIGR02118 family)
MIKVVRFVKKRDDITREQFKEYWLTTHSQLERLVLERSAMKKIVATFATGEMVSGDLAFDGFAELYFDSLEDMRALFDSDIPAMMRKDEENFVDMSVEPIRVVTEEYLIGEKGQ